MKVEQWPAVRSPQDERSPARRPRSSRRTPRLGTSRGALRSYGDPGAPWGGSGGRSQRVRELPERDSRARGHRRPSCHRHPLPSERLVREPYSDSITPPLDADTYRVEWPIHPDKGGWNPRTTPRRFSWSRCRAVWWSTRAPGATFAASAARSGSWRREGPPAFELRKAGRRVRYEKCPVPERPTLTTLSPGASSETMRTSTRPSRRCALSPRTGTGQMPCGRRRTPHHRKSAGTATPCAGPGSPPLQWPAPS